MQLEGERRDALRCGLVICAVSLLVCVVLWPLSAQAKAFPLTMNLCIGLGGLLLVLSGLRPASSVSETMGDSGNAQQKADADQPRLPTYSPLIIMLFMAGCFFAMPHLGFALTTPLLVFGLLFLGGIRRWLFMVMLTLILEVIVFVGFRLILYISIPAGIFDPTEFLFRLFNI